MKKALLTLIICAGFFVACEKNDVPSLDEQKEGKWQIKSYTEEKYQPATNTVTRREMPGGAADYMNFMFEKVYVNFDSIPAHLWSCTIFDYNTLRIEGKKWDIVKLDAHNFHLSLAERDSTPKIRDVVRFELVRP